MPTSENISYVAYYKAIKIIIRKAQLSLSRENRANFSHFSNLWRNICAMDVTQVRILIVDPERHFGSDIERPLQENGYRTISVRTENSALEAVARHLPNLVFKSYVSIKRERRPGLMEQIQAQCPDIQFIFVSPTADVQMAMEAIRRGAFDCLPLPCERAQLLASVQRALQHQKVVAETPEILGRLKPRNQPNILTGSSAAMSEIQSLVQRVADTDVTVLIEGESGTGKELVARTLHERSLRSSGPFVAVNCAALPESIIESELFGHVRGAFTGAVADKAGRFELANNGTLFLDEIGDLSLLGQADLLRVLEDGIYRPLGSRTTARANTRIVAATNHNLEQRCAEGRFREDLLYRLNVITITLPPLRERPEDIAELAEMFCQHFCLKHRRPAKKISVELGEHFRRLPWPGNVRQLRNVIERMVLTIPARTLRKEHLPSHLADRGGQAPDLPFKAGMTLEQIEEEAIRITLAHCRGSRTQTAQMLGISRRTLQYRISRFAK